MKLLLFNNNIRLAFIIFIICLTTCKKNEDIPIKYQYVEETVIASVGGTLSTSDSLKLTIPPNALIMDGTVFLGRTGNEPNSVPNKNLKLEVHPITIRIPSESILKPIQLSFPNTFGTIDTNNYFIFLYNGSTYFPVEYSVTETEVIATIDIIDWESSETKNVKILGDILIFVLKNKQTPPASEMDLKKVTLNINTNEMSFSTPTANTISYTPAAMA